MVQRFAFDEQIEGFGFRVVLGRQAQAENRCFAARNEGEHIYIDVPQGVDIEKESVQKTLKGILSDLLLLRAQKVLPVKMAEMERLTGLKCGKIKFNKAGTRWGSCSSKGDINLSCYMMMLPERLVEYVIVHELCHTKYMNHGSDFKKLWRGWFYDYKILDEELKAYGRGTWWIRR